MKTITNISNITDNTGEVPVVTFSNPVTTFVKEHEPRPNQMRFCRIIMCDNNSNPNCCFNDDFCCGCFGQNFSNRMSACCGCNCCQNHCCHHQDNCCNCGQNNFVIYHYYCNN